MSVKLKHWQDAVNLVVGLWLLASPVVLGFSAEARPAWNSAILGAAIALVALHAFFEVLAWQEWANAAFGAWLIASPWVLGFAGMQAVMLSTVIAGAVVFAMAIWALATDKDIGGWWSTAD